MRTPVSIAAMALAAAGAEEWERAAATDVYEVETTIEEVSVQEDHLGPRYVVSFAKVTGAWCDHQQSAYIEAGNGDLAEAGQVRRHELALEMLDTAKLAALTRSPVKVAVDSTDEKSHDGTATGLCPVVKIGLLPKPDPETGDA